MKKLNLLILIVLLIGCSKKQDSNMQFSQKQIASLQLDSTKVLTVATDSAIKIDLNRFLKKQSFDFGSLVKEVKLIPLETTDESLLDNILKIIVTDSHIYIYDKFKGGGIVVFDINGKYIKRIANGQAPGELYRLYDIDFDKSKSELVAYQHPFLMFYNASGEFSRQQRLPMGFYNFSVTANGYIFKSLDREGNGHLGHFEDCTFLVTDKNFKLKSVGLPYFPSDVNLVGYNYLYHNNSNFDVTQNFTDTIYQYMDLADKLKAKYILDFSKKKLPESYLQGSWEKFDKATRENNYYFYLGQYIETENNNVFFLENKSIGQTIIYRDKKSGNLVGGTSADYNQNEIPPIAFPKGASGSYLISLFLPSKNDSYFTNSSIINYQDKQKVKNLTEDDNPVLVMFKLKNF